jgi:formylglycine-generating enzyme required for sulfatase activity
MRYVFAVVGVALALGLGCGPRAPNLGGPPLPATVPATPFVHELGMEFVVLPVGRVETPEYDIEMRRAVLIGATEVTNKQFEAFVAAYRVLAEAAVKQPGEEGKARPTFEPSVLNHQRSKLSPGDEHPVSNVTAEAAVAFCKWLTEIDPLGRRYMLPDVMDWEYAARGGLSNTSYPWGRDLDKTQACYATTGPRPVGSYSPNAFGLYDVVGNVSEWVVTHDFPPYELRGGSWKSRMEGLKLPAREGPPGEEGPLDHHGFRVLCEPPLRR